MTEIAKAYVQIIPSMEGFNTAIKKNVEGEAGEVGEKSGGVFSKMFAAASQGGLRGFAGAAGTAMLDFGKQAAIGIAKVSGAALAAGATAAVALGKQALNAYKDYEQLTGGVETLFKSSSDQVMQYARRAYETAGLSANEYMETVTSFSASLLQSLGGNTAEAAEVADRAIIDMSDNANKMGTSMQSIQNAYQGFAKQNYTMLDNLKLGYGGTKEEMARLIKDAAAMTEVQAELGVTVDASSMSFGNIVNAISVMQKSLGIAGTTSKEASSTIQGSVNAMKAAWQNLLVGIADDNADFNALIDNFVNSAVTAGENIIPRVETIIGGLGSLITQASQRLVPLVVQTIVNNLPSIVAAGIQLIITLAGALIQALPQLIASVPQIIQAVVNGIRGQFGSISGVGREIVNTLGGAIRGLAGSAWSWGSDLMANFIGGIRAWFGNLYSTAASIASIVRSYIGFSEPELGPLSNFHTFAPDMMKLFAEGIYENRDLVADAMDSVAGIAASEVERGFDLDAAGRSTAYNRAGMNPGSTGSSIRTDVVVKFEGSLSQLAMILQPYVTAETLRLGGEYAPA